jgi:hypothetical protein
MGLVFDQVNFDGRAPALSRIADKGAELCGLPMIVQESSAEEKGNLYDQHGELAFACAPQELLEISSYRPGAVRKMYDEFTDGVEMPIETRVTGLNEPAGTQSIYLRGSVGLETLMGVTVLALEALGGRPLQPVSDEMRREYGTRLTEDDLLERRNRLRRQLRRVGLIQTLLLPVTLPIFALGLCLRLVTMPWRLRKAWKLTREALDKRDHEKLLRSLPDFVDFAVADPADFAALDLQGVEHYSQALEGLGFVHLIDYTVRYPGHALSNRFPGFARLWMHPAERCFAEVNQAFSRKHSAAGAHCVVVSWLDDGWDLSTSDREPSPLNYAWRRPRSVWSRHPEMSPAQLVAEHLRRRRRMVHALGIAIVTESTSEAYFRVARRNNAERKEALRGKPIRTIREEMQAFKQSPLLEWSGELPP